MYTCLLVCILIKCRHWRTELDRRKCGKKPRLLIAILKCFWVELLIQGLLLFVEVSTSVFWFVYVVVVVVVVVVVGKAEFLLLAL